jgi:uncharacterized cupredoxin-like copper-binding protein
VRTFRLTAVAALGAAALIAPTAASAASPIKVNEKEFSISGIPKTLKHGVKYTITLTNKGQYPHDLLFDGKKVDDVGVHNKHAVAPGKNASFSITFPAAGTYEFYCAIKGHAAKGMKGKVKVT